MVGNIIRPADDLARRVAPIALRALLALRASDGLATVAFRAALADQLPIVIMAEDGSDCHLTRRRSKTGCKPGATMSQFGSKQW